MPAGRPVGKWKILLGAACPVLASFDVGPCTRALLPTLPHPALLFSSSPPSTKEKWPTRRTFSSSSILRKRRIRSDRAGLLRAPRVRPRAAVTTPLVCVARRGGPPQTIASSAARAQENSWASAASTRLCGSGVTLHLLCGGFSGPARFLGSNTAAAPDLLVWFGREVDPFVYGSLMNGARHCWHGTGPAEVA